MFYFVNFKYGFLISAVESLEGYEKVRENKTGQFNDCAYYTNPDTVRIVIMNAKIGDDDWKMEKLKQFNDMVLSAATCLPIEPF